MNWMKRKPENTAAGTQSKTPAAIRTGRGPRAARQAAAAAAAGAGQQSRRAVRETPARSLRGRGAVVVGIAGVAGLAAYLAVRHWRAGHEGQTLPVVAEVNLRRYCGTWYEQARLPNRFQRHAGQVSAHYHLRQDGGIDVLNRCVGQDGHIEEVQGVAKPVPVAGVVRPGRLAVRFAAAWLGWLPPVWSEYWIIQLDEHYQYALVGTPDRRFLWVLSRRPRLEAARVKALLEYAGALGFPVRRVIRTAV
ncbi:MAG: lipocalin family protein [Comamonas sp.]